MRKILIVFLLIMLLSACAPEVTPASPGTVSQATQAPTAEVGAATDTPAVTEAPAATETPAKSEPQILTRAITSEPSGLDPHGTAGAGQNVILPYVFDTLVYRDMDNTYKPFLAEEWEVSPDGKQVTFFLRSGITFHDGTPLNAEAVKFTFDRIKEVGQKAVLASMVAQIESIEVVDDLTVRFNFAAPSSTLFSSLATPYAGIISPAAAQEMKEGYAQAPVGSGPFMFEKWEPGTQISLVKNPNYNWAPQTDAIQNKGAPLVDRLVFKIIPDVSQQVTALQAGEVDMLFVNQPSHVAKLERDPDTDLRETVLNSLIYLGFNVKQAPFDDVKMRQAIAHAVNKEELLQTALGGIGEVAFAPLAPTLPGFDPSLKAYELGFDLAKAEALLTEAGYAKGADGSWSKDGQVLKATLLTSTRPPNPAIATVLQSQLAALGVALEIQALDSTAAQEAATAGQFDLLLWRYDWNDADVLRVYLSTARIGRTNRNFYSNPVLDTLLDQAASEMDEDARNALYLEAQQIILQDAPWQPLYTPIDYMAIRKDVQNVVMGPMGRVLLNEATRSQ